MEMVKIKYDNSAMSIKCGEYDIRTTKDRVVIKKGKRHLLTYSEQARTFSSFDIRGNKGKMNMGIITSYTSPILNIDSISNNRLFFMQFYNGDGKISHSYSSKIDNPNAQMMRCTINNRIFDVEPRRKVTRVYKPNHSSYIDIPGYFDPFTCSIIHCKSINFYKNSKIAVFEPDNGWMHPLFRLMRQNRDTFKNVKYLIRNEIKDYTITFTKDKEDWCMNIDTYNKSGTFIHVINLTTGVRWDYLIDLEIGRLPIKESYPNRFVEFADNMYCIFICELFMRFFSGPIEYDPKKAAIEDYDIFDRFYGSKEAIKDRYLSIRSDGCKEAREMRDLNRFISSGTIPTYDISFNTEEEDLELFKEDREWYLEGNDTPDGTIVPLTNDVKKYLRDKGIDEFAL